jgi:enoyl-CoA hydratase
MSAIDLTIADGIAEVIIDKPPVNALGVGDVWEIDRTFKQLAEDESIVAVILGARGKGFNGGADIKEMQSVSGFDYALGSGAACYAAFDSVYRTPVPVIAAVNGYCMGLGIGLVGSCDFVVASTTARFALPEVDQGALGCASHLAKLVPPMRLRQMTLTCEPVTAQELHAWGSIYRLVEPDELMDTAREAAGKLAAKRPRVLRAAKHALNAIDIYALDRNYRMEQGFTYELNLAGDGSEARNAFVTKERLPTR